MASNSNELDLIRRLVNHDRDAWLEFVRTYQDIVVMRARRVCKELNFRFDSSDIDDICGDVFASLLSNDMASLRQFKGLSTVATWLSVITRRTALRRLTKKQPDRAFGQVEGEFDYIDTQPADEPDVLGELIREEDTAHIRKTLKLLSERDKLILDLFYQEQIGYREISERMGISINSVGPKLQRAQQRLEKLLRRT